MPRSVFFSFHYDDIMNANIVRNSGQFKPSAETGFYDRSLWEEARTKGDAAIQKLIDRGLANTSVTVFLIGTETHARRWCLYERDESIRQNKGLLGIHLPNEISIGSADWLRNKGIPVYIWNHAEFGDWVESAARAVSR